MEFDELQNHEQMIQRMFKDMYLGHGKNDPPVLTRLDRIEQVLAQLRSWKWIIIAATVSMFAEIIRQYIK